MKSTGIKTTLIAISITLLCGLFPVLSVSADVVNYGIPPMNDFNEYPMFWGGNYWRWIRRTPNVESSGYVIVIQPNNSSNAYGYLFGSDTSATMQIGSQSKNSYPNGTISWTTYTLRNSNIHTYNNVTFYAKQCNGWFNAESLIPVYSSDLPTTEEDWYNLYLLAMTQVSPIDTGSILNLSLSTRFVNEQRNNSSENLDIITWNGRQDSNLNDLTGINWFVDIRARKIEYQGNSTTDLLSRTQNEAILTDDYFNIISINASHGTYQLTWGDVYEAMDISAYQMLTSESLFYTYGWVYEVRLRNADTEDVSEWQTVYTLSSLPPQDTQDFSKQDNFNSQATEIIYKVDTQNLNTNTTYVVSNYYYNNVPIDTTGDNPTIGNKPWYVYLLEGITGLVNTIIEIIGGVMHDIITGIFDFISELGVNVIDTFKNIFNGFNTNLDTFNDNLNDVELPQTTTEGITTLKDLIQIPFTILNDSGLSIFIWIPLALCVLGVLL